MPQSPNWTELLAALQRMPLTRLLDVVRSMSAATRSRAQTQALIRDLADQILALDLREPRTDTIERALVERALDESGGVAAAAARLLNIDRKALERLADRYGLERRSRSTARRRRPRSAS